MQLATHWLALWTLCCTFDGLQCLAAYVPLRQYEGLTFFDGWAFYGNVDNTTWGNVTYQDRANATSKRLAYVNDAGHAIIKVDNTTTLVRNAEVVNRDSIRLTSLDSYGMGSLIVLDAVHLPFGCSVWPSFWTYGIQQEWPNAGEIDIMEGINGMERNQMALHSRPGCFKEDTLPQSGSTLETNCALDQGCIVAESKPNSFGPSFAQAGGGVYALLMEATGFNIWFFSRTEIPANLASASASSSLDISSWGTPTGAYPPTRCDLNEYFPPQNLVLLTTLCGVWAGNPSIYETTCPGLCFEDNILGSGSNYADAYWEIRYVRAYINESSPLATALPTTTTQPGSISTSAGTATGTQPTRSTQAESAAIASRSQNSFVSLVAFALFYFALYFAFT